MRSTLQYISIFLFLAAIFSSCEETIEFEGEALERKLVLYSVLNPDSVIDVYISYSHAIFDPSFTYAQVRGADVSLFRDDTFLETLSYRTPLPGPEYAPPVSLSSYVSASEMPVPGSTYRVEVSLPGYQSVSSEAVLPTPVPIISLDTTKITYREFDWEWSEWRMTLRFSDPPDEENYYRLVLRQTSGYYTGEKFKPYSNEYPIIVSDEEILWIETDDPLLNPEEENSIFGGDVPNAFSVFSDELIGGKQYELDFIINPYLEYLDTSYHEFFRFRIELQSISKDLFLYLRTYSAQWEMGGDFFAEPVIVYSNINAGLGIFGASASSYQNFAYGSYPVEGVYYITDQEYYDF